MKLKISHLRTYKNSSIKLNLKDNKIWIRNSKSIKRPTKVVNQRHTQITWKKRMLSYFSTQWMVFKKWKIYVTCKSMVKVSWLKRLKNVQKLPARLLTTKRCIEMKWLTRWKQLKMICKISLSKVFHLLTCLTWLSQNKDWVLY